MPNRGKTCWKSVNAQVEGNFEPSSSTIEEQHTWKSAQARQALMAMGARRSAKPHLRPGLCRPSRHGMPLALTARSAGVLGPGRRVHYRHVEAQGLRDERGQLVIGDVGLGLHHAYQAEQE